MHDPTQLPDDLSRLFRDHLGRTLDEAVVVRSPGRMNLLGEHTDYNGGFVLPIAIDRSTWVVAAPAEGQVRVWSEARGELDAFTPGEIRRDDERLWANYVRAVAWALEEQFGPVPGADVLITGDLPLGSGVSSSASLEVGTALAFLGVAQREMPLRDVALMCQRAENQFVGVQCGIMDQFAVALCEAAHALLLDCLSLETQNVALAGDAPVFFVCDTAKERTLAASAYNQRRAECESAARHFGHESLRQVTPEQLEAGRSELPEHVYRRCRHVLSENARVHEAIAVMGRGAWERFGELLQASHASLRDDYEVSCDELNIMCELAMEHAGCLGARMVGAGFGGCAMAAVRRDAVAGFAETVGAAYQSRTGLQPRLFAVQAAGGAAILPH